MQGDLFFKKTHNKNLFCKMGVWICGDHVQAFHECSFFLRLPGLAPLLAVQLWTSLLTSLIPISLMWKVSIIMVYIHRTAVKITAWQSLHEACSEAAYNCFYHGDMGMTCSA